MNDNSVRRRLLASTIAGGAALGVLLTSSLAQAQTPIEAEPETVEAEDAPEEADATEVEGVIVTGSRIRRSETSTAAPVTVIDPQSMADRGIVQAGEALNQTTSITPSFPQAPGSGAAAGSGQQFPNLFNLGPGRTLTLVNGRRFVTSSQGLGDRVVDTNIIPVGLIQRIDVVQAGGAAVYGSDAIAGVVNYVLRDDFEGIELDAQYGVSDYGDYGTPALRATLGRNFFGGRANLAFNVEWSKTDSLLDYDRPRTNLGRITAPNPLNTGPADGQPTVTEVIPATFWEFSANGLLFTPAPAPVAAFIFRVGGVPQQFNAAGDALIPYNTGVLRGVPFAEGGDGIPYQELAALRTGVERFSTNLLGRYDITDRMKVSTELLYAEVQGSDPYGAQVSNTVLNPAAGGSGALPIARTNPFLSPQVRAALGPGGPPLFLSKFWVGDDLLPTREALVTTKTFRALVSLDGDFDLGQRELYWSLSASTAETQGESRAWGVWASRLGNAVNAVSNSSGQIVCAINADATSANDDPACAPLNPFGRGNVSPEARAYVTIRTGQDYRNTQDNFLATIGGDVFQLPAGPLSFSAAYEYRAEAAVFIPSLANALGLTAPLVPTVATSGEYDTKELSGELLVPVFGGDFTLPFVQALELSGAYRRVKHSLAGEEDVWGTGLRWDVIDGVRLRASRSRNFRAPTLDMLFAPSRTALGAIAVDPCDADRINAGPAPATRLANCQAEWAANPGRGPLAGFQDPSENFAQALITTGGNPNLENELSDTFTWGFVLQPVFIPGLTIVADRIEVDLTNGLSAFTPANFLATCYDASPQPADVCSRFTRGPTGQVLTAQQTTFNAGKIIYRGEVYNINYSFPVGRFFADQDLGNLELAVEATHTEKLETSVTGFDRSRTDRTTATPHWRARFDARYTRGPVRATYSLYYLPRLRVRDQTIESTPTPVIGENIRHSVSGQYDFGDIALRAGVENFTDEQPSYPTRDYGDIIGRYFFVGLRARY